MAGYSVVLLFASQLCILYGDERLNYWNQVIYFNEQALAQFVKFFLAIADADFTLDEDNFKGNCHALKCINVAYSLMCMYWTLCIVGRIIHYMY